MKKIGCRILFLILAIFLSSISCHGGRIPLRGGWVTDLLVSGRVIYAAVYGGGVWKSLDSGATWQEINDHLTNFYVKDLAIDSQGIVYAATMGGLFRLEDAGWYRLLSQPVTAVAVDPENSEVILVGTEGGGILKSVDQGTSFHYSSRGLTYFDITVLKFSPAVPGRVYAGTSRGGLFYSNDSGDHWVAASGIDVGRISDILITRHTASPLVYVSATQGRYDGTDLVDPNSGPLYVSHDGVNFNKVGEYWGVNCLAEDPQGRVYFGTRSGGPFGPNPNPDNADIYPFANLVDENSPLYTRINALAFVGDVLIAGVAGRGIYYSPDGGSSWQKGDLDVPVIEALRAMPGGGFWAGSRRAGLIQHNPDGTVVEDFPGLSLSSPPDRYPTVLSVEPVVGYPGKVAVGTEGRGLFITEDGYEFHRVLSELSPYGWYTFRALASDTGHLWAACYQTGLYQSNNGGGSFSLLGSVDSNGVPYLIGTLLPLGNGTLLAGRYDFGVLRVENESVDEVHLPHPPGLQPQDDPVERQEFMRISVKDISFAQGRIFLATNKGLYISEDGGGTFHPGDFLSFPFGRGMLTNVAVSPGDNGLVYASTWEGQVYISTDGGESFSQIDTGLPTGARVKDMMVASDGKLLLGTDGYGVWEVEGDHPATGVVRLFSNRNLLAPDNTLVLGVEMGGFQGEKVDIYFSLIQPSAEGGSGQYYLVYAPSGSCSPICLAQGYWSTEPLPFLQGITFGLDSRPLGSSGIWYFYSQNPGTIINDGWIPPSSHPIANCTLLPDGDYTFHLEVYKSGSRERLAQDTLTLHLQRGCP